MEAPKHSEILLESGTNELQVLEFKIDDHLFGINVAKVEEILVVRETTPMQKSHPDVEGIFRPRDDVVTVIDMAHYLNLPASSDPEHDIFILTRFNQRQFAFHVHSVVGIIRISWTHMQKPDQLIYGGEEGVATAIAEFDGQLITILDFEKIVVEICPQTGIQYEDVEKLGMRSRRECPILIAEDSMLLSKIIVESLHRAGYVNTVKTDNGQEAWDYLSEALESGDDIRSLVACVVSDIEMPQMDGHRLTKLIKESPVLRKIPVILFSSLIDEEMRRKGEQLGADAQISKPEIAQLVTLIDKFTTDAPEPEADE